MIKLIYPAILSFCLLTTLTAQPTINSGDLFLMGSEFIGHIVDDINFDAGPEGSNQVWDFSTVVANATEEFSSKLIPASDAPNSSAFPEANFAWQSTEDSAGYSFLNITDSKVEFLGFGDDTSFFKFDNPETNLVFPFTYQDQFTDTYRLSIEADEGSVVTYGMLESTADAYGTVITPNGTYENVLRIKTVSEDFDTISGMGVSLATQSSAVDYSWFSPSENFLVANYYEETNTDFFGMPTMTTGFIYYTPAGTTTNNRVFQKQNWEISNTYFDGENLVINLESGVHFSGLASINDLMGRTVQRLPIKVRPGANWVQVPLTLIPGLYVLHVQNGNQEAKNKKFIYN